MSELNLFRILCVVMKKLALISTVFALPTASIFAQGQSDIDVLRSRVDSAERRVSILERELTHLRGICVTAQAKPAASGSGMYVVSKGDSLSSISKRHNITVESLKSANGLSRDDLSIGQKLRIPGAALSGSKNVSHSLVTKKPASFSTRHKVQNGETFYSIARAYNTTTTNLVAANPNVNPTSLRVGQTLNIVSNHKKPILKRGVTKSIPKASVSVPTKRASVAVSEAVKKQPKSSPVSKAVKKTESSIRTITVNQQMTYGQFAGKYGASTTQLNALNGLNLNKSTMLAKGSELYVPQY